MARRRLVEAKRRSRFSGAARNLNALFEIPPLGKRRYEI